MKLLLPLFIAYLMLGCSATKQPEVKKNTIVYPPPVCFTDSECSIMWNKAIEQIQKITGMKLRILTESYGETYTPRRSYMPSGSIKKIKNEDGSTTIKADFFCQSVACGDLQLSAENLFNGMVEPIRIKPAKL